jgi:hypothetical protein
MLPVCFVCLLLVFTLYFAFGLLSTYINEEVNYLQQNHRVSLIIIYTSTKEIPNGQ